MNLIKLKYIITHICIYGAVHLKARTYTYIHIHEHTLWGAASAHKGPKIKGSLNKCHIESKQFKCERDTKPRMPICSPAMVWHGIARYGREGPDPQRAPYQFSNLSLYLWEGHGPLSLIRIIKLGILTGEAYGQKLAGRKLWTPLSRGRNRIIMIQGFMLHVWFLRIIVVSNLIMWSTTSFLKRENNMFIITWQVTQVHFNGIIVCIYIVSVGAVQVSY